MLNKAVVWRRIGSNPLAELKPLPHDKPVKQRRSLSVEEVQAILAASPDYLRAVWMLFMTTGLRRSEVVNLKFADVDFARRMVVIPASIAKNHQSREVPLDDYVLADIQARRAEAKKRQPVAGLTARQTERQRANFSRDHIYVTQACTPLKNNLLRQFYSVCRGAGIEGAEPGGTVDLHALRVSFITLSIEHGASPKAVQAIVGHSSLNMTMGIYARATDTAKRDAIGVLPFATVSMPEHVLRLSSAHKLRTTLPASAEQQTAS